MKKLFLSVGLVGALTIGTLMSGGAANAKGCIKGAIVGGVAGHYAGHHGFLGAAAGCIIGHHEAKKHARERERAAHQNSRHENSSTSR